MIAAAAKKLGWDGEPTSKAMFRKAFLMPKGAAKTELTRNAGLIQAMEEQRATPFRQSAGPDIEGTGEERVRGVAESMARQDKTGALGDDKPTYNTMDFAQQEAKAKRYVSQDYEGMKRVAMGEEPPPYGVLPEAIYNAVAEEAEARGDLQTTLDLGNKSDLISEGTTMGRRIAMHGQRDDITAVDAIREVSKARADAAKAKGMDVSKAKSNRVKDMESAVKRSSANSAKKTSWDNFIASITCEDQ